MASGKYPWATREVTIGEHHLHHHARTGNDPMLWHSLLTARLEVETEQERQQLSHRLLDESLDDLPALAAEMMEALEAGRRLRALARVEVPTDVDYTYDGARKARDARLKAADTMRSVSCETRDAIRQQFTSRPYDDHAAWPSKYHLNEEGS